MADSAKARVPRRNPRSKTRESGSSDGTPKALCVDRTKARDEIYSIDTPPPNVSGSLHIRARVFYHNTDVIARFQRMADGRCSTRWGGRQWPADRAPRAELYGVRCDPSLPYDPAFEPRRSGPETSHFHLTAQFRRVVRAADEGGRKSLEHLWRYLGSTLDWR